MKKPFWSHLLILILLVFTSACGSSAAITPTAEVVVPTAEPTEPPTVVPTLEPTEVPIPKAQPLLDDFEGYDLALVSLLTTDVGFLTWTDGSPVSISSVVLEAESPEAMPDQSGPNTVLALSTEVKMKGWAGFTHAFTNDAQDEWSPLDWSDYGGISLWIYGRNSGATFLVDVQDNRNPGSKTDDAERYSYFFADNFEGWKFIEIPFSEFNRKEIGNGAPNDGLNLTEVHGYAVGVVGDVAPGPLVNYVDEVRLYGTAEVKPVEILFDQEGYAVEEGNEITLNLSLTKPADEEVTVWVDAQEGNIESGEDFEIPGEPVIFQPGETSQSITITTVDYPNYAQGTKSNLLVLRDPINAALSPKARTILTVEDIDPATPNLLDNMDHPNRFQADEGIEVDMVTNSATSTIQEDTRDGMPDNYLSVQPNGQGSITRPFGGALDWSAYEGLSFWLYGSGSGEEITFRLYDNAGKTTADTSPADWELVWSDEFDGQTGDSPDWSVWQAQIGDGAIGSVSGWGNSEFEYYTDDPANVSLDGNGNLVITAQDISGTEEAPLCWYGSCEYTSSRIITQDSVEFTYGRVEARLKLPYGQGIWPAFWMLGTDINEVSWPGSGEIDIMEFIGKTSTTAYATIHGPGYSGGDGIGSYYTIHSGEFSDDFHTFAVEWTPDGLTWFIDGTQYFSVNRGEIPEGTEWVFDKPFYLLLNLAVGGNWPGSPDETTIFPQEYVIDYVRVYGSPTQSEVYELTWLDDYEGWQEVEIPFSALHRAEEQPPLAPNDGLNLSEVWGYGFTFNGNSEYLLDEVSLMGK